MAAVVTVNVDVQVKGSRLTAKLLRLVAHAYAIAPRIVGRTWHIAYNDAPAASRRPAVGFKLRRGKPKPGVDAWVIDLLTGEIS